MGNWLPLAFGIVSGLLGQKVLIVRPDGRGFYGQVIQVTGTYVELQNGNFKNMVVFGPPAMVTPVTLPGIPLPTMGIPKLNFG